MAQERVVTVGIQRADQSASNFHYLMEELRRLVETAGGRVVKEFHQRRDRLDPATLIGKGKVQEVATAISTLDVKTVVFDDDLSASQHKNIEKLISAKIIDRTRLILDIFAQRARTKEGQCQVELAQLNYLVPRLTGAWRGFSQQVGGIGTRGPGERKIEVERRYVRDRIKHLKKDISEIKAHRNRARLSREQVPMPQVALIGYTNVGKSTLLNKLIGEEGAVYADDKLFATLDPTTRRVKLASGRTILFTDTVGFIQKLPHDLVDAFHATLEEVSQASLLVHLVDATADNQADQRKTVLEVVKELGAEKIPMITAFNKADCLDRTRRDQLGKKGRLLLSAKTGLGISNLLNDIEKTLEESLLDVEFNLPFHKRSLLSDIYRTGYVVSEKSNQAGSAMRIKIDPANWKRISQRLNGNS